LHPQLFAFTPSCPKAAKKLLYWAINFYEPGTSVAAHTREASRARSDAEFCSKLDGALEEADESQLWIELLRDDCGIKSEAIDWLHSEADELISIFVTMVARSRDDGK